VDESYDKAQPVSSMAPGVTRRDFIQAGAAAGALAFLLPTGCRHKAASGPIDHSGGHVDATHGGKKRATCVALANGTIVTSDDNGRLIVSKAGAPATQFDKVHSVSGTAFKAAYVAVAGKRVLTAGYDGIVNIHDLTNSHLGAKTPTFKGHRSGGRKREVWVAILTPDGKKALSATNDGQILLWDPDHPDQPASKDFKHPATSPAGPVGGLAFLPPDSDAPTHFLSTYSHGDIHLWDIADASRPIHTFSHNNSFAVNGLAVSKGGDQFVSGGFDGTIRVWSIADFKNPGKLQRKEEKKIRGHSNWVWRVALSPDAPLAASASEDGSVRVWDISGDPIRKVDEHNPGPGGSMGVVFGPQNTIIFTRDEITKSGLVTTEQVKW